MPEVNPPWPSKMDYYFHMEISSLNLKWSLLKKNKKPFYFLVL